MTTKYILVYEPRLRTDELRKVITNVRANIIRFDFLGRVIAEIQSTDKRSIEKIKIDINHEIERFANCISATYEALSYCRIGKKVMYHMHDSYGKFMDMKIGTIIDVNKKTLTCKINIDNKIHNVLCSDLIDFKEIIRPTYCKVGNQVMVEGDPNNRKRWVPGKILEVDTVRQLCIVVPNEFSNYRVTAPWHAVRPIENQIHNF